MEIILIFVLVAAFILVIGVFAFWSFGRSKDIVHQWAESEGYELLECEYRLGRIGPFLFTSSSGQTTCRIAVRTPDGKIRRGWAKCGGFVLGILDNKIKIVWDD